MNDFIFASRKKKDIEEMKVLVNAEGKVEAKIISFNLEREIAFRDKLYKISQNKALPKFQKLLLPVFQHMLLRNRPEDFEYSNSTGKFVTHKMLVDNIKSRNS